MIIIAQIDVIDDLYYQLRKIERDLNAQFIGVKARITCNKYRPKSNSKESMLGRWVQIRQVRVASSGIYFRCKTETLQGDFILELTHPLKHDQLEIA